MSYIKHMSGDVWGEYGRLWIKHNTGRQRYHRYIMEKYLGRKLLPNEIVHHKDGDKMNNDLDNLKIMSQSKHMSLHQTGNHNKRNCKPNTKETNEKIRLGNLGLKRSEQTRQNISKAKAGTKYSDEHKKNMSVAHKKRYTNIEERKKHSDTMKEWWRLRKEHNREHQNV